MADICRGEWNTAKKEKFDPEYRELWMLGWGHYWNNIFKGGQGGEYRGTSILLAGR